MLLTSGKTSTCGTFSSTAKALGVGMRTVAFISMAMGVASLIGIHDLADAFLAAPGVIKNEMQDSAWAGDKLVGG